MTVQDRYVEHQNWRTRAACQYGPSDFYPEDTTDRSAALMFCSSCPVRLECLEWALQHHEQEGTWGGLPEDQRAILHHISDVLPVLLAGLQVLAKGAPSKKYYISRMYESDHGRSLTADEVVLLRDLSRPSTGVYKFSQRKAFRLTLAQLYIEGHVSADSLTLTGVVDDRQIWRAVQEYLDYYGVEMVS